MMTPLSPSWLRRSVLLALAPVAALATGVTMLIVQLSFRLTNPMGYEHPGPVVGLKPGALAGGSDPWLSSGMPFQDVTFHTADRSTLRGWLAPGDTTARVGVVTAHGRGADRRDFLRHLPIFHELGMPTLLFDYREHGASDGAQRGMSMGYREAEDISAAVHYLKRQFNLDHVVVVGVSLGASSAILAAAQDPAISAVIAESPFASMESFLYDEIERRVVQRPALRLALHPHWWPHLVVAFTAWRQGINGLRSPYDVVDRLSPRPLLLIHGTGDTAVSMTHSEQLFARAGSPRELWIADGAEHTQVFDEHPDEYRARVSAFLRAVALEPVGSAPRVAVGAAR